MRLVTAKRLSSIVTALVLAGASAVAQTAQERQWCENETGMTVDQRIDGCSAVIKAGSEKGEKLAEAFNNRGIAYRLKGDHERAIADYSQAIKLNAKFAAAHNNRGVAYDHRGEYDRAIADYDQALKLAPSHTSPSATMTVPSTTTTRRSSSSPTSPRPATIAAGRGPCSASSSPRLPTATRRSG